MFASACVQVHVCVNASVCLQVHVCKCMCASACVQVYVCKCMCVRSWSLCVHACPQQFVLLGAFPAQLPKCEHEASMALLRLTCHPAYSAAYTAGGHSLPYTLPAGV